MSAPLPASNADFHHYAFANACLRVYTIVSLRDKVRKDNVCQTEASRGLHWEMAALFDHLSACKMFGDVPIPTAVVPMLRHYTSLYEANPNPTVDIHAFPFEFNDYMTSRVGSIQGNGWWESLLEGYVAPQTPQTQGTEHYAPGQQNSADGNPVPPTQGLDVPQGPFMSTSTLNGATAPQQPPAAPPIASAGGPSPPANGPPTPAPAPAPAPLSTVADPAAPYFAVNTATPADSNAQTTTSNQSQRPNGSRFIPYTPPGVPALAAAGGSAITPVAPRQAIIAPPVKKPGGRRKSIKTSETVDDDSASQPEGQVEKEIVAEGPKKGPLDSINPSDFTKPHDGPEACANCFKHGRKCLTSKDGRLKRCLDCRLHQTKCAWPAASTSPPATNGEPSAAVPPAPAPAPSGEIDTTTSAASSSRPLNRYVAEVVVTPARRGKRKAPDAPSSASSASKRSMHLRSRGPVRHEEEEEEEEEEDPQAFGVRAAAAHGGDAYMRSRIALLVDMARTSEMRLADVLGRVAELEAANRRMEKMIAGLGSSVTSTSPKRK